MMMNIKTRLYSGCLLAGMLWLPGALLADCSLGDSGAVSVYSLSGQGNFNCADLNMEPVNDVVITAGGLGSASLDWAVGVEQVDTAVIEDSSGKRCLYNYGPGATGGVGLAPPTDKPIADFLFCADDIVQEVPNTPPVVTITTPADNSTFSGEEEILFIGTADDAEDGDLASRLTWSSSLDGPLGSGASISVSDLSAGTHDITAQVSDDGGLVGSALVSVTVEAIVAQICELVGDDGVLINGVRVDCPDGDEPRLVCSADLSAEADKFRLGNAACCLCNATATECDPDLAEGQVDPDTGLEGCPDLLRTKEDGALIQVPSTLMFNNDPYYCYTIGGKRTCFAY